MIKKISISLLLVVCSFAINAQDVKKEVEKVTTKMDLFSSKTGTITKFIDTKLPNLKSTYSSCETRIRKISNGSNPVYFYQIEKEGKYSNSKASIEYNDLLEVLKALVVLKQEVEKDIASNPDYLENKFVTVDGFQIGYYVSNSKSTWYIKLEKYGSDNTLFIDNVDTIESALVQAKNKIDELKKL